MKNTIRLVGKVEENKTTLYVYGMGKKWIEHRNKIMEKLRDVAAKHGVDIKK